jgi:hypothetical protein
MTYRVTGRWGGTEDMPSEGRMREVLAELDQDDPEHPDAWPSHESGWSLSVFQSGLVVWEYVEDAGEPRIERRHQAVVSREKALDLWLKLSRAEFDAIEQEAWRPGYSAKG